MSGAGVGDAGVLAPRHDLGVVDRRTRARKRRNVAMSGVIWLSVVLALTPLVMILVEVIRRGAPAMSWEFLTSTEPFSFRKSGGGFVHGLVGTLYMVGLATVITVPLGVFAAVFLVEYPGSRLAGPVRFFTDVMTGVPSVFVGLFVYTIMVSNEGLGWGFGTLAGAIALAILMLPILVRSSEEILKLISQDLRNAGYGLGARRWQVVTRVVLPAAASGLVTGAMLAVARAAGETAPLILTALGTRDIVFKLQGAAQTALPLLVFDGARNPFAAGQERAWAGALELMLLVLVLTLVARLLSARTGAGRARRR